MGLPIIEHYCERSGKTNTSILVKVKECCCKIAAQNLAKLNSNADCDANFENHHLVKQQNQRDDCCDTETTYQKADFEAISIEKSNFDFGHFVAILPIQIQFKNLTEKSFFNPFQILHFADLPPPNWKLGKLFIVFIQVFRL